MVGLFGAAYASTAPKPDAGASPESDAPPEGDNNPLTGGKSQAFTMNEGEASDAVISGDRWLATVGCLALIIMAMGGAYVGKGLGAAAMAGGRLGGNRDGRLIWSHGHPIVGFFSGLLMGIGITVLLQQFAVWPLTIVTAIVSPVVIAIICSLRAWLGRSYRMVPRTS